MVHLGCGHIVLNLYICNPNSNFLYNTETLYLDYLATTSFNSQVMLRAARGNGGQDAVLPPQQPELGMRHLVRNVPPLFSQCKCTISLNIPSLMLY